MGDLYEKNLILIFTALFVNVLAFSGGVKEVLFGDESSSSSKDSGYSSSSSKSSQTSGNATVKKESSAAKTTVSP